MNMAVRTGAWAKSGGGVPTARDYVQDGIIAMWDGIENAGWGMHDMAATVWKDLVGGYDAIQAGSPIVEDDAFLMGGKGYFVVNGDVPAATVCEIIYDTNGTVWNEGQGGLCCFNKSDICPCSYGNELIVSKMTQYVPAKVLGKNSITILRSTASQYAYKINGNSVEAPYRDYWSYNSGNVIGRRSTLYNTGAFVGRIHGIRLYNKLLSDAEIAANYAIDKARFNLP